MCLSRNSKREEIQIKWSKQSDYKLFETMMFFTLLKHFVSIIFYQIHNNFQGRDS